MKANILSVMMLGCAMLFGVACATVRLNQESALDSMEAIRDAQLRFKANHGNYGTLAELGSDGLIKAQLSNGIRYGYRFQIRNKGDYEAVAVPIEYGKTGGMSYYLDASGIIRASDKKGREASVEDSPVPRQ